MNDWRRAGGYEWSDLADLAAKLTQRLEIVVSGQVLELRLSIRNGAIVISGRVTSEAARSEANRQLASFTNVPRIIDELEVTATFHPASDDDWFFSRQPAGQFSRPLPAELRTEHTEPRGPRNAASMKSERDGEAKVPSERGGKDDEPREPAAVAITRYPKIGTDDALAAGVRITITADLLVDRAEPDSPAMEIATMPPGWSQLDVDVSLMGPSLIDIEPAKAKITIFEDGRSTPAVFGATLRGDLPVGAAVDVFVIFSRDVRILQTWQTSLGATVPRSQETASPSAPAVLLARDDPSPTFSVIIKGDGGGNQNWFWFGAAEDAAEPLPMTGDTHIGDAKVFAAGLLANCPGMGAKVFRRRMEKIGEDLWMRSPVEFRTAYLAMRRRWGATFPIQLLVDEHCVPWEMMLPDGDDGEGVTDHLLFTHPIARWPMQSRGGRHVALPAGSIRSFVPEYDDNATLPAARREGAWLTSTHGAKQSAPTVGAFLQLLSGADAETIELIHFAGHGRSRSDDPDDGLHMQDGWVSLMDLSARATGLGPRDHPVVILNACEVAATSDELGWVEGWGPNLADRGFGAIVAPLWRVQDGAAHDVVVEALDLLLTGRSTIGESFTRGRAKMADRSVAAFAFTTYGDVMARVGRR